jgi:hypothetical protein
MQRLNSHEKDTADTLSTDSLGHCTGATLPVGPLLLDIRGLAYLLARSVPSLHRDDAAGRLPAALRIGGSKRWRYPDIVEWVELGCPSRVEFEALRKSRC